MSLSSDSEDESKSLAVARRRLRLSLRLRLRGILGCDGIVKMEESERKESFLLDVEAEWGGAGVFAWRNW